MERWTKSLMDSYTSLEFAKAIVHERYVPLNHYSPLATKLNKTEFDLQRLIAEEYDHKGHFFFEIKFSKDDLISIIGKEEAAKITDEMMEEITANLKEKYIQSHFWDDLKDLLKNK